MAQMCGSKHRKQLNEENEHVDISGLEGGREFRLPEHKYTTQKKEM